MCLQNGKRHRQSVEAVRESETRLSSSAARPYKYDPKTKRQEKNRKKLLNKEKIEKSYQIGKIERKKVKMGIKERKRDYCSFFGNFFRLFLFGNIFSNFFF